MTDIYIFLFTQRVDELDDGDAENSKSNVAHSDAGVKKPSYNAVSTSNELGIDAIDEVSGMNDCDIQQGNAGMPIIQKYSILIYSSAGK